MKQLTIEEKAKRYDEAMEKAKNTIEVNQAIPDIVECVESLFPELAESGDEEIRKSITEFFKNYSEKGTWKAIPDVKKWIDWLEKQGEQKSLDDVAKEITKNKKTAKSFLKSCGIMNANGELADEYKIEQDEQNPVKVEPKFKIGDVIEVKPMKCHDKIFIGKSNKIVDITEKCYILDNGKAYSIEELQDGWKLSEQKSTNNIEPKFNGGDWVIYNNDICQIVKREEGCNKLVTVFGIEKELVNERNLSTARLWTIQDAKDGDVLTYNDSKNNVWVCIFKEYANERVYDYCTLDKESFWERSNWNYLASFSYTPATQEQRDTLIKAMSDAGYTFDFESKKLKKIEQEPADKVEQKPVCNEDRSKELSLSLQIQAYLNTASDELYAKGKSLYSEKRLEDIHKCMLMWQKLHNAYFYQKPTEWSEEDKYKISRLTSYLKRLGNDVYVEWLESLKEKYSWKPSDEQMKALENAMSMGAKLDSLYNELKKLKD